MTKGGLSLSVPVGGGGQWGYWGLWLLLLSRWQALHGVWELGLGTLGVPYRAEGWSKQIGPISCPSSGWGLGLSSFPRDLGVSCFQGGLRA